MANNNSPFDDDSPSFQFDAKLDGYLRRLLGEYAATRPDLAELVSSARVAVVEGASYDNWNGGTHGHDVHLFLPPEVMGQVRLGTEQDIGNAIARDLNHCAAALSNETVNGVVLELEDDADPRYQRSRRVSRQVRLNPDKLSIWKQGQLRLFLSHRDQHKAAARALADALAPYGVSAFVAHDTIEPMTTWQKEIEKGLETMQVMVMFITDDFYDSFWTNQEVGIALGKAVPIIPLKLQHTDPKGFPATVQALKGRMDTPVDTARAITGVLLAKLGFRSEIQRGVIGAFLDADGWDAAKERFDHMASLVASISEEEADRIAAGFSASGVLQSTYYLVNGYSRLKKFLEKAQRHPVTISGDNIAFERPRRRRA